jgi:hypothetical protein
LFAKFDASTMSSIPDELTTVIYCDGDFSQINAIKSSINLFIMNKMIANKQHHASYSAVEQPADLAMVFLLIKLMLPSSSVQNIPADRCPMTALMIDAFKEQLNDNLNLPPNKIKSIIDFISTLSEMATKACSVKKIQHGIITAGLIDGINVHFLVFDTIISMCQQNPKWEKYENIEENMTNILYQFSEYCHIAEDKYNQMGIVRDSDSMGWEVLCDATISRENYQSTKCLTHEHQICLWNKRLAQNQHIKSERKELANQKHLDKITQDDDIVSSLFKKLGVSGHLSEVKARTVKEEYLIRCTLQMFADMKCDNLDALIVACQDAEKPEFTVKSKIPKKAMLSEVLFGARNKILITFDCRQTKTSIRGNIAYNTDITNDDCGTFTDQLGVFTVSLRKRDGDMVLPAKLMN